MLPRTRRGIPLRDVLLNKSWSSLFETLRLSGSAASTTYLKSESALWQESESFNHLKPKAETLLKIVRKIVSIDLYTIAETERQ